MLILVGGVGVEDEADPPRVGQAAGPGHPAAGRGGLPASPGCFEAVGVGGRGHPPQHGAHRAPCPLASPWDTI